jgi:hypothetical protein
MTLESAEVLETSLSQPATTAACCCFEDCNAAAVADGARVTAAPKLSRAAAAAAAAYTSAETSIARGFAEAVTLPQAGCCWLQDLLS